MDKKGAEELLKLAPPLFIRLHIHVPFGPPQGFHFNGSRRDPTCEGRVSRLFEDDQIPARQSYRIFGRNIAVHILGCLSNDQGIVA